MARPAAGPIKAESSKAAENTAKTVGVASPNSCAMGAARMAGM